MQELTEHSARGIADEFVRGQRVPDEYTLEFGSIVRFENTYQVRYTKVFKTPTKENPPYRLVIVEPNGTARWGNP